MHRELQLTNDGSHTISIPEMGVTYHSHHGAIGESRHVYIEAGLNPFLTSAIPVIHILEIGLGTGLNALLSLQEAMLHKQSLHYTAIELYPLTREEYTQVNYGQVLNDTENFLAIHTADWEKKVQLNEYFTLHKKKVSLLNLDDVTGVHCIYFDAFSPTHQPELWTEPVFSKLFSMLLPGGTLVTYCSKTIIRKAMAAAGFAITKIPGPWGKREMVRAGKDC
ncbi:MAG: tRNA (5-methylaminomethyl-2-thiouridine)(34)-methyltransferase MnmD [Bacteroidota bacterium]